MELLLAKQQNIFIETTEYRIAIIQQCVQRQIADTRRLVFGLAAAAKVGNLSAHEVKRFGKHAAGYTQTDDASFQTGNFYGHFL